MPASSRSEPFDVAVVALSARALAASARRAGLKALAIDLFADADTREFAALAIRAEGHRRGPGFDRKSLLAAIETHAPAGLPVVLGAGFEHAPGLMRAISRRNPVVGATPDQVALLKDPERFAALLSELGIPHPPVVDHATVALERANHLRHARVFAGIHDFGVALDDPRKSWIPGSAGHDDLLRSDRSRGGEWLSKRIGASGGAHIRLAGDTRGGRRYLQLRVPGRSISALFIADGRSAKTLGLSEQWTDPAPRRPFRYGGAVGPIDLPEALAETIAEALNRIVAATRLTGLASADMIVSDGQTGGPAFHLIEINPRPGATLDVFDHDCMPSLIRLHLDACAGRLPTYLPAPAGARAAAIVYAERPVRIVTLRRPLWTADWPSCDETLPAGAPVCTVLASAASPAAARALVMERRAALLNSLRDLARSPTNAMVPA